MAVVQAASSEFEGEFNAALDLWHGGDREGAIAALKGLVARCPDEASIHGILGGYLYERGCLREALSHTQRTVQLSPKSELAARQHFHVLCDLDLLAEALQELRRFHESTGELALKQAWADLIDEVRLRHGKSE